MPLKGKRNGKKRSKRNDPKLIHSYIRRKMNVKKQIRALKDDKGELTVDRSEKAHIINSYFESVFTKEPRGSLREFENMTNVWDRDSLYKDQ